MSVQQQSEQRNEPRSLFRSLPCHNLNRTLYLMQQQVYNKIKRKSWKRCRLTGLTYFRNSSRTFPVDSLYHSQNKIPFLMWEALPRSRDRRHTECHHCNDVMLSVGFRSVPLPSFSNSFAFIYLFPFSAPARLSKRECAYCKRE